jgi:hypothetical protein
MRNSLPDAFSTGNFSFSHCLHFSFSHFLNFSFSKADRPVAHTTGGGKCSDGGSQHRDDDLNGFLLDEVPDLLAQFVKELHSFLSLGSYKKL